jgi:hypothetical protein
VELEVSLPVVVSGDLEQGESLVLPETQLMITLDDISVHPTVEPPSALLSLSEADIVLQHFNVTEGHAEQILEGPYSVGAPVVSPGYSFAENRATIEVFNCR